jgi:predicted  nucleic acid-binding Zn-ribbon protein
MADQIVIDLGWVDDLRADVASTRSRLSRDSGDTASIDSSDKVNGALRDFLDKWDERRGDLADTLESVEEALEAINESFTATEDELLAQLNGETP